MLPMRKGGTDSVKVRIDCLALLAGALFLVAGDGRGDARLPPQSTHPSASPTPLPAPVRGDLATDSGSVSVVVEVSSKKLAIFTCPSRTCNLTSPAAEARRVDIGLRDDIDPRLSSVGLVSLTNGRKIVHAIVGFV